MSDASIPAPQPTGELMLRDLAMPADANPDGDIFGGWLLSQMDIAGGMAARQKAQGRVATIAIDSMVFHKPVNVGDALCCYAELLRKGTTSMTFRIQAFVLRQGSGERELVTEGTFTFVALGEDRRPRPVDHPA